MLSFRYLHCADNGSEEEPLGVLGYLRRRLARMNGRSNTARGAVFMNKAEIVRFALADLDTPHEQQT